jgi:hypothetical protein
MKPIRAFLVPALVISAFAQGPAIAAEAPSYSQIDLSALASTKAIAGTTAAGTPAAYANRGAVCAFNGSGLDVDGLTHGTTADGAMFMLSANNSGSFPFYLQVDLGETRTIDRVKLFNFNFVKNGTAYTERGVRNFLLYVSNGASWKTSVSAIRSSYSLVLSNALAQATGTADYVGETFDFSAPVSARFVALVALDDWDDTRNVLNYNGLSEIQLFSSGEANNPEPPVWSENGLLLEAEAFDAKGGWVVDPQFADVMGSPYLLAHGLGKPVADASTTVEFPTAGVVRALVRTRDWTPDWTGEKPGRFRLAICGAESPDLGVAPSDWGWVDAGTFNVAAGQGRVALRDQTGFDGRCDAIWLAPAGATTAPPNAPAALAAWRAAMRGESTPPDDVVEADFVVVGGGMAGTCAAVAAADAGLTVALVQDRPMLGGNASSEIRVKTQKAGDEGHWIVRAVKNTRENGNAYAATDDAARAAFVANYPGISCHLGWRACGVETNEERRIVAVDARHVETGARRRFVAPLYADCTGDGWLGFWAGATYRMGREAASEYGESLAPAVADAQTMGSSLLWSAKEGVEETTFPDVPWATQIAGNRAALKGDWTWEAGMEYAGRPEDTIYDAETLRDRLLRAIYGSFSNAKRNAGNARQSLDWVPWIAGKRESRRIIGDYVVRQGDVETAHPFEDAIGVATWSIDLHYPADGSGYIAATRQITVPRWWMPYRSLCCRDVPNLLLAGRCASYTHVAFGSSRVMHAGGQQGVAAGYAAALCRQYACDPRELYRDSAKTSALQALINKRGDYNWPDPDEAEQIVLSLVVDNDDAEGVEISGNWSSSSWSDNRYGASYLHNGKQASDGIWVRFTPAIPSNATYRVSLSWNGDYSRGSDIPVEIVFDGGVTTCRVDQTASPVLWNVLGAWPFAAGTSGSVRILTAGQEDNYVIADAARFELVVPTPVGDADGNGLPNDWERRHFLQRTGTDPDDDPDGDNLSNFGEWLAGTDPHDAASRFQISGISLGGASNGTPNRKVTLSWPSVEGRTYTVMRADRLGEPFVVYREHVAATPPENTIDLPADDADSAFYRIAIETP